MYTYLYTHLYIHKVLLFKLGSIMRLSVISVIAFSEGSVLGVVCLLIILLWYFMVYTKVRYTLKYTSKSLL